MNQKAPMVHTPLVIAAYEAYREANKRSIFKLEPWGSLSKYEQALLAHMFLAGANWMSKIVAEQL